MMGWIEKVMAFVGAPDTAKGVIMSLIAAVIVSIAGYIYRRVGGKTTRNESTMQEAETGGDDAEVVQITHPASAPSHQKAKTKGKGSRVVQIAGSSGNTRW
jgi:hypothetical protein